MKRIGRPPGRMSAEARAAMIARRNATLDAHPEVRARMSEARKRALADPEVRARMSEASKRAWADPEVRARISEARKRALADPEVRARISEARKRALADPEVRARMSEASKRAWAKRRDFEVPGWVVAAGLDDDFRDIAQQDGEEAAAAFCRALKRQMAAAV
jgi:hypothetical protein